MGIVAMTHHTPDSSLNAQFAVTEQVGEPAGVGGGEVRHADGQHAVDREVGAADRPDLHRRAAEGAQRLRVAGHDERAGALAEQQRLAVGPQRARGRRERRGRPRGSTPPARRRARPRRRRGPSAARPRARAWRTAAWSVRSSPRSAWGRSPNGASPRSFASSEPVAAGAHEPAEMIGDDVALLREAEAAGALGLRAARRPARRPGSGRSGRRRPRCRARRCRRRPGSRARGRRRRGRRRRA